MKRCPKCGNKLHKGDQSCPSCQLDLRPVLQELADQKIRKKKRRRAGCLVFILIPIILFIAFLFLPDFKESGTVLNETFKDNKAQWPESKEASISEGFYRFSSSDAVTIPIETELRNGKIIMTLESVDSTTMTAFGIQFRRKDGKGSELLIDNQGGFSLSLEGRETVVDESSLIKQRNIMEIEMVGSFIRVKMNETTLLEGDVDIVHSGSLALVYSGGAPFSLDELVLVDYTEKRPNVKGTVFKNGEFSPLQDVRAYRVADAETLGVSFVDQVRTEAAGDYAFYLPDDLSYFIQAGDPMGSSTAKMSGDRYVDMNIPNAGSGLDITIREVE